jgi:hypothetical protein
MGSISSSLISMAAIHKAFHNMRDYRPRYIRISFPISLEINVASVRKQRIYPCQLSTIQPVSTTVTYTG